MSFAFMRRFAFVDVGVPHHDNLFHKLRNKWIATRLRNTTTRADRKELRAKMSEIFRQGSPLMSRRELGPAIASDMLRYLEDRVIQVQEELRGIGEAGISFDRVGEIFPRLVGAMLATRDLSLDQKFPLGFEQSGREAYFVLHRALRGEIDVVSFVTVTLDRLPRGLACRTEREQSEYRGRVRGRVAWAKTWKARLSDEYDPTRFVCTEVRRQFGTPENQLVKFMVETAWSLVEAIPPVIRQGVYCRPGPDGDEPMSVGATFERISRIEATLPRLRVHPQLREISIPERITLEHLRRAETSKMEEYGQVASLYRRYHRCLIARDWQELVDLGHTLLPLPARLDAEGKQWLRFAAMVLKSLPGSGMVAVGPHR